MADTSAPGGTTRQISWGNRLLAPLALIVVLVAIFAIVSTNTGDDGNTEQDTKAQINAEKSGGDGDGPGEPEDLCGRGGRHAWCDRREVTVSTKRLERLNPDMDPQTLNAGQELKIR